MHHFRTLLLLNTARGIAKGLGCEHESHGAVRGVSAFGNVICELLGLLGWMWRCCLEGNHVGFIWKCSFVVGRRDCMWDGVDGPP